MNYRIISDFLNNQNCEILIKEAEKLSDIENYQKIHNNRLFLTCSNLEFKRLCQKSVAWNNLEKKLASEEFFNFCCKQLNLKNDKFFINNHFKNKKNNKINLSFEILGGNKLKNLNSFSIIKFVMLRIFKRFYRNIKFSRIFNFFKYPIELLYDYSVAGNGYGREVHRDSDNRLIVFLLYLNSLDKNTVGGNLEILRFKNDLKYSSAKPSIKDCEIIESVIPETGKLVIFQNDDQSFHRVTEILNAQSKRHFIYGGFTLLGGKNPYITNKTVLKTEFHLYE